MSAAVLLSGGAPPPAAAPPRVARAVEALASAALGRGLRVRSWTGLNYRVDWVQVARVELHGADDEEAVSVIAKYRIPDRGPPPAEVGEGFAAERFAYRFLMRGRDAFPWFPRLLRWDGDLFLLEDLGADEYAFPSILATERALARVLAALHVSTADRRAEHDACRAAWGYPAEDQDTRPHGVVWSFAAFGFGRREVLRHAAILLPDQAPRLQALLAEVEAVAREPGPFLAFVHDDMATRRQSVVREGRFFLLDWEYARYFHCLTDLAMVLVGKIERRTADRAYLHVHPNVTDAMVGHYREAWAEAGGPALAEEVWDRHLVAMLAFQAMVALALVHGLTDFRFAPSVPSTIRSVLCRLVHHLRRRPAGAALADVFDALQGRMLG